MEYTDGSVKERSSGKLGTVYYVYFKRRIGENVFIVEAISESGGLAAGGTCYRVKKVNNTWTREFTGELWIS